MQDFLLLYQIKVDRPITYSKFFSYKEIDTPSPPHPHTHTLIVFLCFFALLCLICKCFDFSFSCKQPVEPLSLEEIAERCHVPEQVILFTIKSINTLSLIPEVEKKGFVKLPIHNLYMLSLVPEVLEKSIMRQISIHCMS